MLVVDVYLFGQILGTHSFFPLPLYPPKMDEVNELLR